MSTVEQINEKADEIIEITSLDNFKKIQNLEQYISSLEVKIAELTDMINQRRGLN